MTAVASLSRVLVMVDHTMSTKINDLALICDQRLIQSRLYLLSKKTCWTVNKRLVT